MIRLRTLWDDLRTNYWFVPMLMAIASVALALGLVRADETVRREVIEDLGWVYTGGPEGARGVLSTIAGSVIGVAGTTFSITIAALSLASGQFGPRLLRGFMRDAGNQFVLGAFTSTFLYCLLVLRTVRGTDETTYVPHLSVTVGIVLAVLNVGVLIYFINHIAESIQVSRIVESVGHEVDLAVDRLFPEGLGSPEGHEGLPSHHPETVRCEESGYVTAVDRDGLLNLAKEKDLVLKLIARPGDHLVRGMPLLSVWTGTEPLEGTRTFSDDTEEDLRGAYALSSNRTTLQDLEFALLQLAEVAVRALSPGTNDPFTAIACIDRLTVCMASLAERPTPPAYRYDDAAKLRVVAEPYPYPHLVTAAFAHIRQASEGQLAVRERLRIALEIVHSRVEGEGSDDFRKALERERDAIAHSPSLKAE